MIRIYILCILLCFSFLPTFSFAADSTLRVGIILPLTGKASTVGVAVRNGILLAQEHLPANVRERLFLRFEDDTSETKQSVSAVQRLLSRKAADVVVTAMSNVGNAVVPITEKHHIPLLSLAYDKSISRGKQYAFTFWPDGDALAVAAVQEAKRRGYKHVAIVSSAHEGNIAMRESLLNAGKNELDFSIREEIELSEADFMTHALRFRRSPELDAIATLMHPVHLGTFARKLRASGVTLPLIALGNFEDKNIRDSAKGALIGQWYSGVTYGPEFLTEYKRRFTTDSTFGSAFGYEAIQMLANFIQSQYDTSHLPHYLTSARFSGHAIPEISANGDRGFRFPIAIKTVGNDGID